ncbi:LanC-like protein GCR2 [Arabidopsis thaliana]|uniref:GPCR n=2 Tax=Arabidopsis TaxID=3701 RepID=A0A178W4B2_ARATH|nr:Lanthionine synthetase C-like [Arabidopsis thaliana x Arabidopsis arenosa]OAP13340.1 GPCR [Arabidopsis thaliana]
MGTRFFRNEMPEFVPEGSAGEEESFTAGKDSLKKLLSLPYKIFSEKLQSYALSLKDKVVWETWGRSGKRVGDYNLYTGVLGTAYLWFKSYQVTRNEDDLKLCLEIVEACDVASRDSERVTFICGYAGVCALGAVAAKCLGDDQLHDRYLARFRGAYELLYGRAGYLWACLFLNKHIGQECVSSERMRSVVEEIFRAGRQLGNKGTCPLMYEWHGKRYWGAAHGLAGIMNVLMHMELEPDEIQDVKGTLSYMIQNRFPSGNYLSSEGSESDRLVHWCHGAPGVALTLVKAAQVFKTKEFVEAAMEAGEVVWNRGLLKRVGICHGISGNTYVFLSLYRLTGKPEYLYRAKAFASFLLDKSEKLISEGQMHRGDRPFSLFEGIGGMAYMLLDMNDPTQALFPGYEL